MGPPRKEYDFRFPGLAPINLTDKENALRVKAVRRGFRRPLLRESRWAQIEKALDRGKPPRIELVYGEWLPSRPNKPMQDPARMFVVANASSAIRKHLEDIIRAHVFDGGTECDQICIYLSCEGKSIYVSEQ